MRANAKSASVDIRIEYDKQVEELEQKLDAMKEKLRELNEAGEGCVGDLKEDVKDAWNKLSGAVEETYEKLKIS